MEYFEVEVYRDGELQDRRVFQDYEFPRALIAFMDAFTYDVKVTITMIGEEYNDGQE